MKSFFSLWATMGLLTLFASCGNQRPQVVKNVQVQTRYVEQDLYLSFQADLNLGAMSFPSASFSIPHPQGGESIGSVSLVPVLGGTNQMLVDVNVSAISQVSGTRAHLPNGGVIPLIAANPTIEIPLGKGSEMYLTLSQNATAIGVAVAFSSFDQLGAQIGTSNLFPLFAVDKLVGAAGIFTSRESGKNGFGLILDVTQYVQLQDIYVPESVAKLNFNQQIPAASKEQQIDSFILRLNKQRTRLRLH